MTAAVPAMPSCVKSEGGAGADEVATTVAGEVANGRGVNEFIVSSGG